ncbi:hypothetical protein [Rhizobium sp. HT1-10]|uniref:hypothetical protein n=1 Tax=Rhizobium sp. HT1-10 TaxID=3111638 RepID=UPI003C1A817C
MQEFDGFDPTLFGEWPGVAGYDGSSAANPDGVGWSGEECRRQVAVFALETKAGDPEEALRILLNDMTREMRAEFDYFRTLRSAAELAGQPGEGGDEAAIKLARADMKSAVDAMSLIVRTLEKIDSLQRQLARDREAEAERHADGPGYVENKRRLLAIIEMRAEDRARAIVEERDRARIAEGLAAAGPPLAGYPATGPPLGQPA